MRRFLFRRKRCRSPNSPWLAALVAPVAMIAGCGGGPQAKGFMPISDQASTDYHFFSAPGLEEVSKGERAGLIDREIERLGSASWESARDRLFTLGKEAIPRLIANIERTEPTQVGVRLVPGPAVPEVNDTWNFGQLVYAVLVEFVGGYTDFEGSRLPPLEKRRWEEWWVRNKKGLVVYSELNVVPKYVRKQHDAMRKDLASRFPRIKPIALKEKQRLDLDKEKAERKSKAIERERQLEMLKMKPKVGTRILEEKPPETEPPETGTPEPGTGGTSREGGGSE